MTEDDIVFYCTAICIPIGFVFLTVLARLIIRRKWERGMLYWGIDLALLGISASLIHIMAGHAESSAKTHLLTKGEHANILLVLNDRLHLLPYGPRAGFTVGMMFTSFVFALAMHSVWEPKEENTTKLSRGRIVSEVIVLGVMVNLICGAAVVYMELLLR